MRLSKIQGKARTLDKMVFKDFDPERYLKYNTEYKLIKVKSEKYGEVFLVTYNYIFDDSCNEPFNEYTEWSFSDLEQATDFYKAKIAEEG